MPDTGPGTLSDALPSDNRRRFTGSAPSLTPRRAGGIYGNSELAGLGMPAPDAAHEGRLQLALRSPGDDEQVATRMIGVADVLGGKEPVKAKKTAARAPSRPRTVVQVIKGSKLEVKTC